MPREAGPLETLPGRRCCDVSSDYLTMVRMVLACQQLQSGRPLKAVATEVGYTSSTALSRAFQRQFGVSPRDWLARQTKVTRAKIG